MALFIATIDGVQLIRNYGYILTFRNLDKNGLPVHNFFLFAILTIYI